ncbi:hypothetical protein [Sphingobium estronivorans]|uniref:hypothetical protein n=1 Tax=Sphingobium estronivorans TaxID=1577690 RepID=UPI00123B5DBC|nr:hypothetical protein [Sphingobium estronivorans]
MQIEMGFSAVEAMLARIHNVADDKRIAFQGRLKSLLKAGLLPHVQQGRGKAAVYGAGDVAILALALEFAQMGVGPERAVEIISSNMQEIVRSVLHSVRMQDSNVGEAGWSPAIIFFDPNGLAPLYPPEADQGVQVKFANIEEFKDEIRETLRSQGRLAVISITAMIVEIAKRSAADIPAGMQNFAEAGFGTALVHWAKTHDLNS